MKLQQAERRRAKIRMCLQGPSGSGKTYSSLLLAYGLQQSWEKIAVIDTECHSADLYAHLGPYKTLSLDAPFSPEKYIEAIKLCESSGAEVIIIDSISHEWDGAGGILDIHNSMAGNSFTNWGKVTPRHNAFIQTIMQSRCHIIATVRSKQDYVLTEKNGKSVPEKVGLKGVQRDGLEYDFSLVFELDIKQNTVSTKDRTSLFVGKPEFKITSKTGEIIKNWCEMGEVHPVKEEISEALILSLINQAKSLQELKLLYSENPAFQASLHHEFSRRKGELQQPATPSYQPFKMSNNGKYSS